MQDSTVDLGLEIQKLQIAPFSFVDITENPSILTCSDDSSLWAELSKEQEILEITVEWLTSQIHSACGISTNFKFSRDT